MQNKISSNDKQKDTINTLSKVNDFLLKIINLNWADSNLMHILRGEWKKITTSIEQSKIINWSIIWFIKHDIAGALNAIKSIDTIFQRWWKIDPEKYKQFKEKINSDYLEDKINIIKDITNIYNYNWLFQWIVKQITTIFSSYWEKNIGTINIDDDITNIIPWFPLPIGIIVYNLIKNFYIIKNSISSKKESYNISIFKEKNIVHIEYSDIWIPLFPIETISILNTKRPKKHIISSTWWQGKFLMELWKTVRQHGWSINFSNTTNTWIIIHIKIPEKSADMI